LMRTFGNNRGYCPLAFTYKAMNLTKKQIEDYPLKVSNNKPIRSGPRGRDRLERFCYALF